MIKGLEKMNSARLMSRPEDYKKIGVKPNIVEQWEDGWRTYGQSNTQEVWYFDFVLNDGTKLVLAFKNNTIDNFSNEDLKPNIGIFYTDENGKTHGDYRVFSMNESTFSKEKCHIEIGSHLLTGNLKEYKIKIQSEENKEIFVDGVHSSDHSLALDLVFTALTEPFRPGTGYIVLGENEEYYNTFMCIPKGKVSGTITFQGKTKSVEGLGYQNHQWVNINHFNSWHHWLWGRMNTDDYSVVIFDLIAQEQYGFARIPLLGISDSSGKLIFDNTKPVKSEFEFYYHEETGKEYPKISRYTFEDDGKIVQFNIEVINEIEVRDIYGKVPEAQRLAFDKMNIQPTYMRYFAKADLTIIDGDKTIKCSGDMIYEFNYCGKPDNRAHL